MVAFILAFTFRVYVLEAYIIPTGSMAPTLLGSHVEAVCGQCGYPVVADAGPLYERAADTLRCPMCFFETPLTAGPGPGPAVLAGDRILVQKYLGGIAEPKRFDVVVFKNPQNPFGSGQNFIKRLTGLPGERLMLLDGNVYVAPEAADEADLPDGRLPWRIARKTDEEANPRAEHVQRAVFQPVYHSRHRPADGGAGEGQPARWAFPWSPAEGAWDLETTRLRPVGEAARNRWSLAFDFTPAPSQPGYARPGVAHPYNQLGYGPGQLDALEDFRLAATLGTDPRQATGAPLEVTLAGVTRLRGGPVAVRARFRGGSVLLETRPPGGSAAWERLAVSPAGLGLPDAADSPRLEFWSVDQELSAWVDGVRVARHQTDLSFEELVTRPPPPRPGEQALRVTLEGPGAAGTHLIDLDLDRDLHHDAGGIGRFRGGANRSLDGTIRLDRIDPVRLSGDQFFLLGDNSPQSDDGRRWSSVDPWIRERYFAGVAPIDAAGRVPRGLLIGRAFFVYYPAARPLRPGGAAIIPDLQRMRRIH